MPDPIVYVDSESNSFSLETEDAGSGKVRPVHGLPSAVTSVFSAIKTATEALAAIISAGKLAVADSTAATKLDSVKTATEAVAAIISASKLAVADSTVATALTTLHTDLATTIAGYVDGLETLAAALNGYVDGLETLVTSTNTKLDTVAANQGVPSGGPKFGQNSDIDTGADRTFSSQALTRGMVIKNISASGQILYISHAATPTATNSFLLYPGESTPFIECTNANVPLMRPNTDNAAACYYGV